MSNIPHTPYKGLSHEGHDDEHKSWSRRSFLQALGIAGSGSMILGSNYLTASAPSPLTSAIAAAETDNILILIRLSGGNDGLSTVIPMEQYDAYANARPNIYIPESKVLKLTDEYGVPSYMNALEPMWDQGQFKAVHGVGYQNQSLSHFTGSDIFANTDLQTLAARKQVGWGDISNTFIQITYPIFQEVDQKVPLPYRLVTTAVWSLRVKKPIMPL